MRVLVCGSRGWTDVATIANRLSALPDSSVIIQGGAKGADQLAGQAASLRGLHVATVYAQWDRHGKAAGFLRNAAMLSLEPDVVLAFSLGTAGTQHTINLARRAGIPVEVIGVEASSASA